MNNKAGEHFHLTGEIGRNPTPDEWAISKKSRLPWMMRIRFGDSIYRVEQWTPNGYRMERVEGPGCYTREACTMFPFSHAIYTKGEVL